jgi:hypothetical protein
MGFPNSANPFGPVTGKHQAKWVSVPGTPGTRPLVAPKRKKGVSALTKIAEQLPMKLQKIL